MAVRFKHSSSYSLYFCTFTCYKWINLFEITKGYDCVYKWYNYLKRKNIDVVGYVIMPNHTHFILYFPDDNFDLNKVIGNAKRWIAYEIIERLRMMEANGVLSLLTNGVTERDKQRGQKHMVFKNSFDAKPIFTERFLHQKLDYIHFNPVRGKWKLVRDYTEYEHSSASFYVLNKPGVYCPTHFQELGSNSKRDKFDMC